MADDYVELFRRPWWRRARFHLFRSARLNLLGWLAVLGWVTVWSAVLAEAALAMGLPLWLGACVGGALGLASILMLDRRQYGNLEVAWSWTDDADVVRNAALRLQAAGLQVAYSESTLGEPQLRYRMRDGSAIKRHLGQ